ncbi:MAG TPA: surface-adhesin E family protein [Allosphingosinicella sp.]|nr:surface-adhesin E family protein [Allosphingosinicella sp.]
MTIAVLTAVLFLQTLPAPGSAQWEPLGPPQPGMTNEVDPASVARSGDNASLRMRSTRAAADPEGMNVAVIAFTVDCRRRTATLDGVDLYRTDGSFGRSVPGDDPRPIGSDPMQRALYERACRPAAPAATPASPAPAPGN